MSTIPLSNFAAHSAEWWTGFAKQYGYATIETPVGTYLRAPKESAGVDYFLIPSLGVALAVIPDATQALA